MSVTREANFAVGTPEGPQSCVWKIKTAANGDIYFMVRALGGEFKVSFHPANATHDRPIWRAALTSEHMRRPDAPRPPTADRVAFKWPHPEADYFPGLKRVFGIIVPEAAISLPPNVSARSLNLLPPPPAGQWTLLWVFVGQTIVLGPPIDGEQRSVAALVLPNEEILSVTHHHVAPVDMPNLPKITAETVAAIQAADDPRMIVQGTFDGVEVWVESRIQIVAANDA
jgi:hypothetical protein